MIVAGLVRADLANLRRDPMLLAAGLAPLLLAGLLFFGFDVLVEATAGVVELEMHRPVFVGGALLLTPMLIGFVVGFLLVEEREEKILDAVAVTPRGGDGFLVHRLALPGVVGALAAGVVAGVADSMRFPRLAAVVVLAGASAVLVTMMLAAVARDRVQALAVSKLTGFLLVAAVAFQFVDGWWRVPLGLVPATWVVEAVVAPTVWPAFGIGLVAHVAAIGLLWRRVHALVA